MCVCAAPVKGNYMCAYDDDNIMELDQNKTLRQITHSFINEIMMDLCMRA